MTILIITNQLDVIIILVTKISDSDKNYLRAISILEIALLELSYKLLYKNYNIG